MANFGRRLGDIGAAVDRLADGYKWWATSTPRRNAAGVILNIRTYKCAKRGCNATARRFPDGEWDLPPPGAHSHFPDQNLLDIVRMAGDLYTRRTHSYASSQSIYDAVAARYVPRVLRCLPLNQRLLDRMADWKRRMPLPEHQGTFVGIQILMELPEWVDLCAHSHGRAYVTSVTAADGTTALIWGDQSIIQKLGAQTEYSLALAISPKLLPVLNNTSQVLTASLLFNGHVFPFAYMCFNDFTYDVVLESIQLLRREIMQQAHQGPTRIITNCDWRLRDAITQTWNEVDVSYTWHSFCLAVMNRAQNEQRVQLDNENHNLILRKLMALAWLPPGVIGNTFRLLKQAVEDSEYAREFIGLMEWFERTFILGLLPRFWSCFEKDYLLSSWPDLIPQLLINTAFSGRRVPTATLEFFQFYESSLKIIAETHRKIHGLIDQRAINLVTTTREMVSLALSAQGTPTFTGVRKIRQWLNRPGMMNPAQALSVAANMIQGCYRQCLRTREYTLCDLEPWDQDRPIQEINENVVIHPLQLVLLEIIDVDEYVGIRRRERLLEQENEMEEIGEQANEENEVIPANLQAYRWRCLRCNQGIIRMVCQPCHCACLCQECVNEIRATGQQLQCPMCQDRVITFEILFLTESGHPDWPIDWNCQICEERIISRITTACKHVLCGPCFVAVRARFGPGGFECFMCRTPTTVFDPLFPPL